MAEYIKTFVLAFELHDRCLSTDLSYANSQNLESLNEEELSEALSSVFRIKMDDVMFCVRILTHEYAEFLMKVFRDVGFKEERIEGVNYLSVDKSTSNYEKAK